MVELSVTDYEPSLVFLALEDGTPAGILFEATWEQDGAAERIDVEAAVRYMFTTTDEPCDILPPDDPWMMHTSSGLGYRMAYPADWDVMPWSADELGTTDVYLGPDDGEIDVHHYPDTGGYSANAWFRLGEEWIEDEFGATPTVTADLVLADGAKVRIYEVYSTGEDGPMFFQEAAIFAGDQAWDLDWYSEPGNEDADREILRRAVETFVPMDLGAEGAVG